MRRRLSLRWVRLRLARLCRLRSLRRLRSPVLLVQGWLQRLLDRGAYGDVNRPGRLDRLGRRRCGKLGLGSGARLRRFGLPVMSVDPIKKRWRENCSTTLLCSDGLVTWLSPPNRLLKTDKFLQLAHQ